MLNLLVWDKPMRVNGVVYASSAEAYKVVKKVAGDLKIELNFGTVEGLTPSVRPVDIDATTTTRPMETTTTPTDSTFKIKVRQYMTKQWDFNDKQNNGVPMPMRIMVGKVLQETKGMVKMELHGQPLPSSTCCRCGRTLTHPVSLIYGLGSECGQHFHINPYETEAELEANYEMLRERMAEIKWTGWIIKSAIEERMVV